MKFNLLIVAVIAASFSASCTHLNRDRTARTSEPAMSSAPSSGQLSDQRSAGLGTGGAGGSGGAASSRY